VILVATLLLAALLAAVFWRRLDWGVYALLFALPFERIGSWALNPATDHPMVRLSQVIGAVLVAAYGLRVLARRQRLRWSWYYTPLVGLAAWAVAPVLTIGYRPLWYGYAALVFVVALTVVVANLVVELPKQRLFGVLLAGAAVSAAFGLYQFVAGALGAPESATFLRPEYTRAVFGFPRIQSTGLEPLYYANYLLAPLTLLMSVLAFKLRWFGRRRLPLLLLLAVVFVLTMSRGAFIGLAIGAVGAVPLLLMKRRAVSMRALGVALGAAALVALVLLSFASLKSGGSLVQAPKLFLELVTVDVTRTGSFTERSSMRAQALKIAAAHPLVGVGIEGISPYVLDYAPGKSETTDVAFNNQALELADETGAPGALLFYGFLLALVIGGVRALLETKDRAREAWLLAGLVALVAVTVQAQSFSGFLLTHLWVLYGLVLGLILEKQSGRHHGKEVA
jgi:hypothetical protein